MIKVAIIIDTWFPQIGGGQINAFEISKRLAQKGTKIDIITRNTGPDNLKLPKNLNVIRIGPSAKPFSPISKINFLFKAYLFVLKKDYDIIHAHAFLPGITARLLGVTLGIPIVFTVHGTSIGTGLNSKLKEWLERFILTQVYYNTQITVSRDFLSLKNVNKKIYYIANGVSVRDFDKVTVQKAKDPTLIFVGRLNPQKNLENLIKSLAIVKQDIPNIRLLIVGDGEQKETLKKTVKKLGLNSNVLFKDWVQGEELIRLYKSSDAFILPSIYEGQPLALLEAWAAKTPPIISATGDCPFLVKNGVNGFLLKDPTGPAQIALVVKKTLGSKNLQSIGQNGYNFVRQNFSWDKSAQKTLEVYENLTKNPA